LALTCKAQHGRRGLHPTMLPQGRKCLARQMMAALHFGFTSPTALQIELFLTDELARINTKYFTCYLLLISYIFNMAHAKKELFSEDMARLARFAEALAHPARIEILRIIGLSDEAEMACLEITKQLPLSQPTCSRHISVLKRSGLIRARIDANFIYYSLQPHVLESFCRAMHATLEPAIQSCSTKSPGEKPVPDSKKANPMKPAENIPTPTKNKITKKTANKSSSSVRRSIINQPQKKKS